MKRIFLLTLVTSILLTLGMYIVSPVQAANVQIAQGNTSSPSPTSPATGASPTTEQKIKFRKQTIRNMKTELEETTSAVQSRNYNEARTKFESALKKWYTFGGTIKRLSPETYEKVAAGFQSVNSSIGQSQPPRQSLIANLQTLIRNVSAAVTISDAND